MENTGSFRKPIFNLLELEKIQALVVNAKHMKNVPGRKTDVKNTELIVGLFRHGLLQGRLLRLLYILCHRSMVGYNF